MSRQPPVPVAREASSARQATPLAPIPPPSDAWLTLLGAAAPGRRRWPMLLREAGSAEALLALPDAVLAQVRAPPEEVQALRHPDPAFAARCREWLARPGRALITLGSLAYPARLAELPDAPLALWVEGSAPDLLAGPQLAMVGSRHPTRPARRLAEEWARYFSQCGLTIISGLAAGIDAASHRGALAGCGGTIAVLGAGLDSIFPSSNRPLAREVAARGVLVSEYPPGVPARKYHFPQRNRIIAGLSLGTLVVEASRRSGSLITARQAADSGREVFAVPGSVHNPLARGCHHLIKHGAKLVEEGADVLLELAPQLGLETIPTEPPQDENGVAPTLLDDPRYRELLDALGHEPTDINELVPITTLTAAELSSMLLLLELEGFVEALPGGRYSRMGKKSR